MFIKEILPESEVILTCRLGKEKRSFTTKVIASHKDENSIIVEAIRHNDTVINFDIDDMVLEFQVDKSKAVMFKVDKIQNIVIKGKTYHLIKSDSDASPVNRRGAVRVPLGVACELKYGPKRTKIDCYVHDISSTGISFTIKTEADINRGDELNCSFVYGENRTNFKIFATAVRAVRDEKTGYLIVGAKFKSSSDAIGKFVMELQREEAQRRRG